MKKTLVLSLMLVGAIALVSSPPAHATCPANPTQNVLNGNFPLSGCPDTLPVTGVVYLVATPSTVNSFAPATPPYSACDAICEDGTGVNGLGQPCGTGADPGPSGDGQVSVLFDFGASFLTTNGCPDAPGLQGHPVVAIVVANNGAGAVMVNNYATGIAGYVVDGASPGGGDPTQFLCNLTNAPKLISKTPTTALVSLPSTRVYDDCAPDSASVTFSLGTCLADDQVTPLTPQTVANGNFYTKTAPCSVPPDIRLSSGWVTAGTNSGSQASIALPSAAAGSCVYIGATTVIGGQESPAVTGWLMLPGPAAASPKATINKAVEFKGTITVNFSTTSEINAHGFNVLFNGQKANSTLIDPLGVNTGGHAYTFSVAKSVVWGGGGKAPQVVVETVLLDGTSINSDAATVVKAPPGQTK